MTPTHPMTTPTRTLTIETAAGAYQGYLAEPPEAVPGQPSQRRAAVILLPEIYNLNPWILAVAGRYARQGHPALVPDLYWRQEAGVGLAYTPEGQQRGRAYGAALDRRAATADILACAAWLRARLAPGQPVAAVGFCLGGELALLAAARGGSGPARLDAAIAYYPTHMEQHLGALPSIPVPALIHLGEQDWRTPPELARSLQAALPGSAGHAVHVYPGADHGFGRFGHPPHHEPSAALAQQRSFELLDRLAPASR